MFFKLNHLILPFPIFLQDLISHVEMAPTAHWTPKEELAFINFLVEHKSEAGDGRNFKVATFQKAEAHLAPLLERGAIKTQKSCRNKYSAVCHLSHINSPSHHLQYSSSTGSIMSLLQFKASWAGHGMMRLVQPSMFTPPHHGMTMSWSTLRPIQVISSAV